MKSLNKITAACGLSVLGLLTACTSEPPQCGDSKVTASLTKVLQDKWAKFPQAAIAKFEELVTVGYETATATAYEKEVGIRTCHVTLKLDAGSARSRTLLEYLNGTQALQALGKGALIPVATPEKALLIGQFAAQTGGTMTVSQMQEFPLSYKVQKDETPGVSSAAFVVSTNVESPVAYARLLALAVAQSNQIAALSAKPSTAPAAAPATPSSIHQDTPVETAAANNGDLLVHPVRAKPCGQEALCVLTNDGTFMINSATLSADDMARITTAVDAHSPVCMRQIAPGGGEDRYTAEAVTRTCAN